MHTMRRCFIGCLLVLLLTSQGWTQTIQLPTVRTIGVNTTVTVPDRGAALLGGNSRSILTPNGAVHSSTRGYVTARIIDLAEMDAAVLAEARRRRAGNAEVRTATDASLDRARFLSRNVGGAQRSTATNATRSSTRDLQRIAHPSSVSKSQTDGALSYSELMHRGRVAMKAGRYKVAKKYFMAAASK